MEPSPPSSPTTTPALAESSHFKGGTVLDEDFKPNDTAVIIGRGKRIHNHSGNKRFYVLIQAELATYSNAPSKTEKSYILAKVLEEVRTWNKQRLGFVKLNPATGRWHSPKDSVARVTVAQAFRDALKDQYSSSKHNKQRRRQIAKGFITDEPDSPVAFVDKRVTAHPASLRGALEPGMGPIMNMGMKVNSAMRMNAGMNAGMNMGMNMGNMRAGRKMSGQETLAHIRGIIQATTDDLRPVESVMSHCGPTMQGMMNGMHSGAAQLQWISQPMMQAQSQQFLQAPNYGDYYPTSNLSRTTAFEFPSMEVPTQAQQELLFEPLPVEEEAVAAREQINGTWNGDAFSASEQTSSFFLQQGR